MQQKAASQILSFMKDDRKYRLCDIQKELRMNRIYILDIQLRRILGLMIRDYLVVVAEQYDLGVTPIIRTNFYSRLVT